MSHSWYFAYNQHCSESVFSFIEKFLLNLGFENINVTLFSGYHRIHKMLLLSAYGKTKWLIQLIWARRTGASLLHICLWFKHCQLSENQLQPPRDSAVTTFSFLPLNCYIPLFSSDLVESPLGRENLVHSWNYVDKLSVDLLPLKIFIPFEFRGTLWSFLLFNKPSFEKS